MSNCEGEEGFHCVLGRIEYLAGQIQLVSSSVIENKFEGSGGGRSEGCRVFFIFPEQADFGVVGGREDYSGGYFDWWELGGGS